MGSAAANLRALEPTAAQDWLLRAALGEGDAALAAYGAWVGMADLDGHLDHGSFRLLPLLYETMSRLGLKHPFMGRLKGIHRRAWYETQQHLARSASVLGILARNGIPTMVTKGVPLALVYYEKPWLRPMADLDVAVPLARAREAAGILNAAGWSGHVGNWSEALLTGSAVCLHHSAGGETDLHWHVLHECGTAAADAHFAGGAVRMAVKDAPTTRPSAGDMLLHVIVHGVRANPEPPIRWIADATLILRSGEAIDWERMVDFAGRQRLAYRLGFGLRLLAERYGAAVPGSAIASLDARRAAFFERLEVELAPGGEEWRRPVVRLKGRLARYGRLSASYEPGALPALWLGGLRRRGAGLARIVRREAPG